jgi:hypothetical protein
MGYPGASCHSATVTGVVEPGLVLTAVEPVQVHHLGPHRDEIVDEIRLRVACGVDLGQGSSPPLEATIPITPSPALGSRRLWPGRDRAPSVP